MSCQVWCRKPHVHSRPNCREIARNVVQTYRKLSQILCPIFFSAITLQPRRLSTRDFVCRTPQDIHYTHIIQTHGHDSQEFRDIHLVILVTLVDTKIPQMCASWFTPFLCNHDDYQHAALCAALNKAHIIHTSSKRMVMTAKNFEIFTW